MNFGFFGIQYSFGLQQTAINPIYQFLGADHAQLPLLNMAGPVTGLLIQPLIGAMSDRTWSDRWGRRKPYFLICAIGCSICLFLWPFVTALWMAFILLWLLDYVSNGRGGRRAICEDEVHYRRRSFKGEAGGKGPTVILLKRVARRIRPRRDPARNPR
jgi:MFS family permease